MRNQKYIWGDLLYISCLGHYVVPEQTRQAETGHGGAEEGRAERETIVSEQKLFREC